MNFHSLSPRRKKHNQQQQQQQQQAAPQGRPLVKNPRTMKPMGAPQAQPPPRMPVDPRKIIVDQIIRDCYSKIIVSEGRNVPEIRYNTHLNIREYSLYPLQPPPSDIPPSQIGSVKNRILVVGTKSSGRVLLQKGKYNDVKHVYQIGRTWDLDELEGIEKLTPDSMILQLNKMYYWKSGEGPDRMMRFIHHLCQIYSKFTGRYPALKGISLQELNLPPLGNQSVQPSKTSVAPSNTGISASKTPLQQPANISANTSTQSYDPSQLYKDLDFTANGKLPTKPMVVMDVDRPGLKTSLAETNSVITEDLASKTAGSVRASHPYSQFSQLHLDEAAFDANETTDSHSFVFSPGDEKTKTQENVASMPSISEYSSKVGGADSPLKNYKPQSTSQGKRVGTEPIEQSAAAGDALREQLEGNETQESLNFQFKPQTDTSLPTQREQTPPPADDEIEEVFEAVTPEQPRKFRMPSIPGGFPADEAPVEREEQEEDTSQAISESTQLAPETNGIDSSIKEIEDFMESQLTSGANRNVSDEPLITPAQSRGNVGSEYSFRNPLFTDSLKSPILEDVGTPPSEVQSQKNDLKVLVDPEIEDMLDEVQYNVLDSSDDFIKKLTRELDQIKRKNIEELTNLDFGKDSLSNEVENASGEVDNLIGIFKRMEINFNMLAPRINHLENDSKGLQVTSINKKILFNDLNEILNKVKVNNSDLLLISKYQDFDDLHSIPTLEKKLSILYEALGAIGSDNNEDDLSSMQALKQFQDKNAVTASAFIQHFRNFFTNELAVTVDGLTKDLANLFPMNILVSFKVFLAYTGITCFIKCLSEKDLRLIGDDADGYLANFLDQYLSQRLKHFRTAVSESQNNRSSSGFDSMSALRKTKLSRFGSQRLIHRLANHSEGEKKKESSHLAKSSSSSLGEPKMIMRMVHETQELILVIQYFIGTIFHHRPFEDFTEYIKSHPLKNRIGLFDNPNLDLVNYKTSSNDLLRSMTTIFGNYISRLIKSLTPKEVILPELLVELTRLIFSSGEKDQDFVCFSFLTKLSERYKSMWKRFITTQVDLLNKSDIRARVGILPAVKNLNEIVVSTELSLSEAGVHRDNATLKDIEDMVKESYRELTVGAVELFARDDPLLKSNAHDEKERAHRNVSVLKNIFVVTQQLNDLKTSSNTHYMKSELSKIFDKTQRHYLDYLLHKSIGKIIEFNNAADHKEGTSKHKKDEKIFIRSILSSYTSKEVQQKIADTHRRLEKHFITNEDVSEEELVKKLWTAIEYDYITIFQKFDRTIKQVDRDFEFNITPTELRRLFASY